MNEKSWKWRKEVFYFDKKGDTVICKVCPHNCNIILGGIGFCRSKVNDNGTLYSIAYSNPCSLSIDPIEKKPLFHFLPQSKTFSLAVAGCNFRCLNCQNWPISQVSPADTENYELLPEKALDLAFDNDCASISFTYSEPVTFYEYIFDIACLAKERGMSTVLVSNGYINEKPLRNLTRYIDAANIDLKTFDEKKHFELTKGHLKHVLNTLKILRDEGVWVEITNLIIPQWSDDMDIVKRMCEWLAENDMSYFPLHFSRFSPMHKLKNVPATPVSLIKNACNIAKESGIKYVYMGNIHGDKGENTYCPECNKLLIERNGFSVFENNIVSRKCRFCNCVIDGIWNKK